MDERAQILVVFYTSIHAGIPLRLVLATKAETHLDQVRWPPEHAAIAIDPVHHRRARRKHLDGCLAVVLGKSH